MHGAMNKSSDAIDETFDTQRFLIELKVDFNHANDKGFTPLHYAFKKKGSQKRAIKPNSKFDPIEIVSSLLSYPNVNLNAQDKYLKTPIHYACEVGAITSSLYMI